MASWLPAVKIALPYLAQLVGAAIPVFTQKPDRAAGDTLTPQQITELQDAVKHNAESIRTLAAQMQQLVQSLEAASERMEEDARVTRRLALGALALALVALGLALLAWLR